MLSKERVESLISRISTNLEKDCYYWPMSNEDWDDLLAILRSYAENTKAGVADETGRGFTYASPVPTRGEGANPSPGLSDEDERALAVLDNILANYEGRAYDTDGHRALAHLRRRLGAVVGRTLWAKGESGGTIVNPGETITFGPIKLLWDGEGLSCISIHEERP